MIRLNIDVRALFLDRHPDGDLMIPQKTFPSKKKFNHLPFAFCLLPKVFSLLFCKANG